MNEAEIKMPTGMKVEEHQHQSEEKVNYWMFAVAHTAMLITSWIHVFLAVLFFSPHNFQTYFSSTEAKFTLLFLIWVISFILYVKVYMDLVHENMEHFNRYWDTCFGMCSFRCFSNFSLQHLQQCFQHCSKERRLSQKQEELLVPLLMCEAEVANIYGL